VVIGAMLISPLMGPIMGMGMAVARLDARAFERAAVTLALGAAVSVAASALIVWASPLKDVTPEILARTRPTLLDLVVAMLSGIVGAYVLITKRPGVVAGVAIATALMPPLAVVGYGVATATWGTAGGAFLLFLTNVVAILGAVFVVARRYGFTPVVRTRRRWEELALVATLLVLSAPLAISLRDIVIEARETARVRSAIQQVFETSDQHITDLQVRAADGGVGEGPEQEGRQPDDGGQQFGHVQVDVDGVAITRQPTQSDAARQDQQDPGRKGTPLSERAQGRARGGDQQRPCDQEGCGRGCALHPDGDDQTCGQQAGPGA